MTAYWAREKKKALRYFDRFNSSTWFDLAHTHPDWKSKGNRFPESRIIVAKLTYELMVYAETLAESLTKPIQIFATICEDTGSNAVYLHTENPNGTIFPYPFENSEWNVTPPLELYNIVDLTIHEIGKEIFPDEVVYVIRKKAK